MVDNGLDFRGCVQGGIFQISDRLVQKIAVLRFLRGGKNQARIRRRVIGLISPHAFEITGIGDDFGELL